MKIFFAVFRTWLANMDSPNECFSGYARCSKHERSGHSRSLSFPSVRVWQRNELTTSHRGDPPTRLGCLRSRQREVRRLIITFRLTNVIPERIIFVSRGITVLDTPWCHPKTMDALRRTQRLQVSNNLDKKNFNSRLAYLSPLWEVRNENDLLGVTVLLFYLFQIRIVTLKARALYCLAYPPSLMLGW